MFNIYDFKKRVGEGAEDKHISMLNAILPYIKSIKKSAHKKLFSRLYITKKTKVLLVLLPEWATMFPPYNLAKLTAISRQAGFETEFYDLNIQSYYEYANGKSWDIDFNPWSPIRDWRWTGEHYFNDIHPHLEPLLLKYLSQIESYRPDVIGFTLYYCNEQPTYWFIKKIKEKFPEIKIIVGGPLCHFSYFKAPEFVDYAVNGEGEQALIEILNSIEHKKKVNVNSDRLFRPLFNFKIDLNNIPIPDYGEIDFGQYDFPNGINSELSRGCIAKCTFCDETHFWQYRQRNALKAVDEIEYLHHEKGTNVIWFIDSLVNGNLKELREFCKSVIEKKLDIHWTGYARCDGKMDLDFFRDLKSSGCITLNYGIESGSQKVLDSMKKEITVEEIEQNLRDGAAVGISALTNWIIAYPTEEYQDFAHTMTLIWRNRNTGITSISPGPGFNIGLDSIVGQNLGKYELANSYYLGHWIRKDFKLSKIHKLVRVKTFAIWLDHLISEKPISCNTRENLKKYSYEIVLDDPNLQQDIKFESFDYNIIQPNISSFADSLINEIWPFFRMMWLCRGGYKAKILFNQKIDSEEFGEMGHAPFEAIYQFQISSDGDWSADFKINYVQEDEELGEFELCGKNWYIADFSRNVSNSTIRARKLSWKDDPTKIGVSLENTFDEQDWERKKEEFHKLKKLNFSFDFDWKGQGSWKI